jgi:hypothetical protein
VVIPPRVIGHIGVLGLLCFLIYLISDTWVPDQLGEWILIVGVTLTLFHFLPVHCDRGSGLNPRSAGHIGVSGFVCFMIYFVSIIMTKGISESKIGLVIFFITSVVLSSFHFFSVKCKEVED